MRRCNYILGLAIVLTLTMMSCEHDFDVDVPRSTQNVVLANFTPDEPMKVYVSSTVPIGNVDSSSMKYPNNADVTLYANGAYEADLIYTPSHDGGLPYYRSSVKMSPGITYDIEVQVFGNPISTSSNKIPKGLELVTTEVVSIKEEVDDEFEGLVNVTANILLNVEDNTTGESYFHLKGSAFESAFNEMSIVNGLDHLNILHEEGILIKMPDSNSSNTSIQLEVSFYHFPEFELRIPFEIEIRKCSRDYYLFHRSVGEQELSNFRDGLLSSQSVQIHNNIVDGVGNFSSYVASIHSVEW